MKIASRALATAVFMVCGWIFAQESGRYVPLEIQRAIENKTRSTDGRPGMNYWQNRSEYTIQARLDTASGSLFGKEDVVYFNNSPDTLDRVIVHLYQDLYKIGNVRDFDIPRADIGEGMVLTSLAINERAITGIDSLERSATNMIVPLKDRLVPGGRMTLSVQWNYRFPTETGGREGKYPNGSIFAGYWYPEIAVFDDIAGWDEYEWKGSIDFYTDFSDYDVTVDVPAEWVVWATGVLQNPQDVLAKTCLDKYWQALLSDTVVTVVDANDRKAGGVTLPKDMNSWHFKAENVPDFAFGTSARHLWDCVSLVVDSTTGRRAAVHAAYSPQSVHYPKAAQWTRMALDHFSKEMPGVPYPFPVFTAFDGSYATEYPMMTNMVSYRQVDRFCFTLVHEIAHSYFPFYMGTNERKYGFMDEGWAQMLPMMFTNREIQKVRKNFDSRVFNNAEYERAAGTEKTDRPPAVLSVGFDRKSWHVTNYSRPGAAYLFLQDFLGEERFKTALHEFMNRWNGKHPTPYDFYNTFENVTGENLDWFWKPWFFEFGYPDLAVKEVRENRKGSTIIIEKKGNVPIPVRLKIHYWDVSVEAVYKTARVWEKGENTFSITLENKKKIKKIFLGDDIIPDVDRRNNEYQAPSQDAVLNGIDRRKLPPADPKFLSRMGITFVTIPGGTFEMGDVLGDGGKGETPVHAVTLEGFSIGKTEVTFAQYDAFCEATGREKPSDEGWGRGSLPVVNVSWTEAAAFCEWLSLKSGQKIRLPSEAEWEYAARDGGKKVRFGNGKDTADPMEMNFKVPEKIEKPYFRPGEYRGKTVPVAGFPSNSLGLYDMSGNVWEWCSDWYGQGYYSISPEKNPQGLVSGTHRVIRGGAFDSQNVHCSCRGSFTEGGANRIGFRLARTP